MGKWPEVGNHEQNPNPWPRLTTDLTFSLTPGETKGTSDKQLGPCLAQRLYSAGT